jgi:serralysin
MSITDFIVNSSTNDFQIEPAITTLADGRVVMTWRSFDSGDGLSSVIRARIFNADGTPAGQDFIVGTSTDDAQSNPSVTVLANGKIVFAWESDSTSDETSGNILARIFNDDGTPVGGDFIVNAASTDQSYAPTVTALTDGSFLMTWDHYGDEDGIGDDIYARIFNADGTPAGAEFIANSTLAGIQSAASVSALSAGRFVMTWMSDDTADGSMGTIRARIFNTGGSATSVDFIVNSTTADNQSKPAITVLSDGRLMFTWQSLDTGDGDGSCIRARIFSATGVPAGADFIVNTTGQLSQSEPVIITLADGRIVISWASADTGDGSEGNIRARVFNADGTAAGDDFIVNSTAADNQFTPSITALHDGNFQIVWMSLDNGDGSGSTIRSTIIDPDDFINTNMLIGTPNPDTLIGGETADIIYGLGDNDSLYGNGGADIIDGGDGSDNLWGGNGADQLIGGNDAGIDLARYDDANYGDLTIRLDNSALNVGAAAVGDTYDGIEGLSGGAGNDTIFGNSANNYLYGQGGSDTIDGGAGDDILDGGTGGDTMIGGDGSDTYYVDSLSDVVSETNANMATGGDDLVIFSAIAGTYTLAANIERLTLAGLAAINGTGNSLNNTITGNSAANIIDGGAGADTMIGGDGSDIYYADVTTDVITETNANMATGGDDLVIFSAIAGTYTLAANIERLTLAGLAAINGTGNSLNNTITGNSAANILDGGTGGDTMIGGDGSDTYYVDSLSDVVSETNANMATGGDDLVNFTGTSGTYTLGANIERLTLAGTSAINGTGNSLNNTITGNSAANIIDGGAGADTMIGGDGSDTYYVDSLSDVITETNANLATGGDDLVNFTGTSGTYTLGANIERLTLLGTAAINGTGNSLNNTLIGNSAGNILSGLGGNDILDGGLGIDTMIGGDGNDIYYADVTGDIITETNAALTTGGDDHVYFTGTSGNFTLSANVERLTLTGSANTNGSGNALDNTIIGNSGDNSLYGFDGNDSLNGGDGNDQLFGGLGADQQIGGSGIDYAHYDDGNFGGLTIYMDNSAANIGTGVVGDTFSGVEGIYGSAGYNIIHGDAQNNIIYGGNNYDDLYGGDGNDYLIGGNGDDWFFGGNGADTMDGGTDTFIDYARYDDTNYGNLTIRLDNSALNTGAAAGDVYINIEGVIGGAGNDIIYGNALSNYIYGQGGTDTIDGQSGNDNLWGGGGNDRFQFSSALNATTNVDVIRDFTHGADDIVLAKAIFASIGATLDASELRLGTAAADANDFIIYNSANGQLFYDANGNGAGGQILFATISSGTVLDINDFMMI